MQFQTERLEIRPIANADKESVLDLLTNETVGKTYMLPQYQNREDAIPLFERLVALSRDESRFVAGIYWEDRFIGMMNDTEIKGTQIAMGYAYLPAFYGRGFATEAFKGTIEFLLSHGFETVLAGAFSENTASIRVMEKCGMTRQEYTDEIPYRDKTHTCLYYAAQKE